MEKTEFWKVIDAARREARGDADQQVEVLMEMLTRLPAQSVVDFDRTFCEYHNRACHWDLWGAAFLIGGGCTEQEFSDFRGWLISRGEKIYEATLAELETLLRIVDPDEPNCLVAGFFNAAPRAWAEITGANVAGFPRDPACTAPGKPHGREWVEDDLEARFPKLAEKFA